MSKSSKSKAFAVTFVVLTVSAIGSIITMILIYNKEISTMNPTPRPTYPSTTIGPPPVMRLPEHLVPERYKIFLHLHFYSRIEVDNGTTPEQTMLFTGNSTVNFHCVQRTWSIYLHSRDLRVSKPVVKNRDSDEEIRVSNVTFHSDRSDFLQVRLNEALEAGMNYSLFLAFEGELSDNLEGPYVSTYHESLPEDEGVSHPERFLAATNLEPTFARRVFPCFDEPEMKAVFDLTIVHRKKMMALGNAQVAVSNIIEEDWKLTHFHSTPKMSTYLFAFVVSEFKHVDSPHERVNIKIFARPMATDAGYTAYAANITGKILAFYEGHFNLTYTQKKLDQIALPDLNPFAMENWGLVTYREAGLLYEDGVSSQLHKETIAILISHELAHQWFGNLVTMKWWNDVWLNEGFASYMTYLAVDHVEPTFKVKDLLVMKDLHMAFEEDALASSHPLSVQQEDVLLTPQIIELFDAITYSKGAIILRMLADLVEEKVFHKGIRLYLRAFAYDNTEQSDLWKYIQQAVDEDRGHMDVAKVMDAWTNQIGFPVVTIDTRNGEIYQRHFLFNDSFDSSLWWYVPIRVMSSKSKPSLVWLETSSPVKKDEFISKKGAWILANVNCTGYYRVNYNQENWERLMTQLETNPHRIPVMNRWQLVDDAFNLARAKLVDVTLALNSTRFLRHERAYLPWESAVRNLEYFVLMFDRSEVYGPMQMYLRAQVKELYNFFGTFNSTVPEDHSLQHNQILAIEVACSNGLPKCVLMATDMFAQWMNGDGTNMIHPNLRSAIYCQAVAAGGKKEWEFAWNKFLSSSETSERNQLRRALSCTKKIWLLSRYLEYTLDPEKIRLMEVASTINYIAKNEVGQALTWNFIRAHWDYISLGEVDLLLQGVTSRFSTPFELQELEHFANSYDLGPAAGTVVQAIEQTQVNIQWVSEHKETILEWFERETAS